MSEILSLGDQAVAEILETSKDYWEIYVKLRITWDNFIDEDNECDFMDSLMSMFSTHLENGVGKILKITCGVDHFSAHEGKEKNDEGYDQMLYVGEKCKRHGHVHAVVSVDKHKYKVKLAEYEAMEKKPTFTSLFKVYNNDWWKTFRLSKLLPAEWHNRFNKCSLAFDNIIQTNVNTFLGYPLKEIEEIGFYDYEALARRHYKGISKEDFNEMMRVACVDYKRYKEQSQKKKASSMCKDANPWGRKLALYIESKTDNFSKENVAYHILEYYKLKLVKFSIMDIVKDRNLFMANINEEESAKLLNEINEKS